MKIILANTYEEADLIANQDPFTVYNYYQEYKVHEIMEANEENNYLLNNQ